MANALKAHGTQPGDRVGILLPQCPETLIAHIAVYKLGCIALPLLTLFGPMAIEYRLQDSAATAVITNSENLAKIVEIRDRLPELKSCCWWWGKAPTAMLWIFGKAWPRAVRISSRWPPNPMTPP